MEGWKATVQFIPGRLATALFVYRRLPDGRTEVVHGDTVETPEVEATMKPTLELMPDMAQAILVALSESGVKLPEASFTEGKLEATEKHLEDMRNLVFKDVDVRTILRP